MIVVLYLSTIYAQFNSDSLIIGSYGVGPEDSPQYYFGSSETNSFVDSYEKDTFHFNTKFVKILLNTPDYWITYAGPQRPFSGLSNIDLLANFNSVGGIIGESDWEIADKTPVSSYFVHNFDWPYFYTSGYNKIWRATERDINNPPNSVYEYRMIYNPACITEATYVTNKDAKEDLIDGWILKGPVTTYNSDVTQPTAGTWFDTRHRGSKDYRNPSPINYLIDLKVRLLEAPSSEDIEVVKLKTYIHYTQDESPQIDEDEKTLDVREINKNETALSLSLQDYFPNVFAPGEPEPNDKVFVSLAFEVISTGNVWFKIDTMHIYDEDVYWGRMRGRHETSISTNIYLYFDTLKNLNSNFFNTRLRYIESIDEPHSINSFWALKKVKDVIAGYPGISKPYLVTHFYPGYAGYWKNENIFIRYLETVNPDPLMFYTYFNSDDDPRVSTYWKFRTLQNLTDAVGKLGMNYKPFIYVVDVWDQAGIKWRAPSENELRSTIMLGLSFGAKGILFEPFFSYASVTGLVDWDTIAKVHSINSLGEFVRDDIVPRLTGRLGTTINKLIFTGKYECILGYSVTDGSSLPFPELLQGSNNFLGGITRVTQDQNPYLILLSLFSDPEDSKIKYAMLGNYEVAGNNSEPVSLKWYPQERDGYKNYILQDVENIKPAYICSGNQLPEYTAILCTLERANSVLYREGACVRLGGEIQVSENITNSEVLKFSDLLIKSGAELTVSGEYHIEKDLILEATGNLTVSGYIFPEGGGKIVSGNWSKSLYRSRSGNKVKVVWSAYPGENIVGYIVYRKRQTDAEYYSLDTLGNNEFSYIDNESTIITGPPQGGEILADYKVTAIIEDPELDNIYESGSSNVVRYNRIEGYLEKRGGRSGEREYDDNLFQNYPNPFKKETNILFSVNKDGLVTIKLYDLLGREVMKVFEGEVTAGEYSITPELRTLPSGTYIYEMKSGNYRKARKLVIVK